MKLFFPAAILIFLGYTYYVFTEDDRKIAEYKRVIEELGQTLDRVWAKELVGDVRVDELTKNPETGVQEIHLTFIQYGADGEVPLFEKPLIVKGSEFYVDALVAKFGRNFVENGDPLRGKSVLLFRRIFGDAQKPIDGVSLLRSGEDVGGSIIPELAQVDDTPSRFEQEIWTRFWELANDREQATSMGLSVVQGEAPHVRPVLGQVYKLSLQASGGLDITPRLPAAVLKKRGNKNKPTKSPKSTPVDNRAR